MRGQLPGGAMKKIRPLEACGIVGDEEGVADVLLEHPRGGGDRVLAVAPPGLRAQAADEWGGGSGRRFRHHRMNETITMGKHPQCDPQLEAAQGRGGGARGDSHLLR